MRRVYKRRPLADRFWEKVRRADGDSCWEWTGATMQGGYGKIHSGGLDGRLIGAHRASWELANGPVPSGMYICHSCDHPPCVRPDHLFIGTPTENFQDMRRKGRWAAANGSAHGRAKIVAHDVVDIRSLHAFGARVKDLATAFGLTPQGICSVLFGYSWGHV